MLTSEKVWFLKTICGSYELPEDVRHYVMTQFCVPFVLAGCEKLKIYMVYNSVFDGKELKIGKDGVENTLVTGLVSLLNDHSITLDTRVNDDRIEKFVRMLEKVRSITQALPKDRAIYVLRKGLIMNVVQAFDLFFYFGSYNTGYPETKPFLHYIAKRCDTIFAGDLIVKFIFAGLEVGVSDECLVDLLNECMRRGVNMYSRLKQETHLSDNQRLNFALFQQTRTHPRFQ